MNRRGTAGIFVLVPALAAAQPSAPPPGAPVPVSQAVRTQGVIHTDGLLDEPDWAASPVTDKFTQIDPNEGQTASQRTEIRVLYDDANLYIGARLFDTGAITGHLGRRDMDLGDSDWLGVMIDSYHDHRTAFGFDVNPVGVRRDEIKTIDVDDNSWDPVWEAATRIDSEGWTAEYRIPFSQLRFSGSREQTWGIQYERLIGRLHEYAVSTYIPKSERGGVPRYGHLEGLHDLRPGKRLEFMPYTLGRISYVDPGGNPYRAKGDRSSAAGLDLLYRVSSDLTLNAAFNPDFGQVEVDPAVVNLGVYETFFQEKRPFFVEGSEIFDFGADGTSGGQIFYSRRIGRAPTLPPPAGDADIPDATTILGAGKLSGKPHGFSVGVLEACTSREEARFRNGGVEARATVEPLSNYFVGRARRELRSGQSMLGGIVTAANRRLDTPLARERLHSGAYAGGLDFRHEWGNRSWAVYGDAEGSYVEGSPAALIATQRRSNHFFQRPDASHLEVDSSATRLSGYSVNVQLAKQSGEHWRGSLGTAATSPRYEVNDLGFAVRTDRHDFSAELDYLQNRPGTIWRHWSVSALGRAERNYVWEAIQTYAGFTGSAQLTSYWRLSGTALRYFQAFDDRLTRGGPLAIRPARWFGSGSLTSDVRKPVTVSLNGNGDRLEFGGWDWNAGISLGLKSSTRWNLSLGPNVGRVHTPAQYVQTLADASYTPTFGKRYIFAPLDQTTVSLETRINITFSPGLTLETYLQPLLSSADYADPVQLVRPRSYDFAPYAGNAGNLDFNLRSLRGNAVLRWEWRQGSTLYLVWQQSREDVGLPGDFDFGREQRALVHTRPDNIFLAKVNYWLNP